ncbi:MAG: hypothetical protein PHS32_02025 [Rhodoferax sp.]|uniref:hypothetical protein n=1 Tax=Rhodoferax sp. TaxID=50421 RepID=UPI002626A53C|nr:hypothetical protein [Rhodoferax sp.]MDD5332498.1 hypothetical protein [Rhodoferax sp.]
MKISLKQILTMGSVLLFGGVAMAKLPAPSDQAKAKAAEAAAKTAWSGKVDNYLLCKSQDKVAAHFYKTAKAGGKETRPAVATAPCADPGPFVYAPAAASPVTTPASSAPAAKKS